MTPKDKADELLSKYMELFGRHDKVICETPNVELGFKHSKELAISFAEEIRKEILMYTGNINSRFVFWDQVKKEIEKR